MKTQYQYIIYLLLGTTLLSGLSSCSDYFLNVDPTQSISGNAIVVDQNTAETAVLGVYSALQSRLYYGGDGYAAMAYLSGGDHIWVGTLNYYNAFPVHEYRPDNTLINNVWYDIYKVVNGANNVIEKVAALSSESITADARNKFTGEAYFLRALSFFDLAKAWGNIPIVLQATKSPSDFSGVKQSDQKTVYTQVLKDLDQAETLLPATVDRNRVTKNTVYALKAKVYLYQENWDKAIEYATKVIGNTNYELVPWSTILGGLNTKESVFELAFSAADQSAHFGSWSSLSYRNQYGPGPEVYQFLQQANVGGDRKALITDNSTATIRNYFIQKLYWRSSGDNPTYILRLAEQYLIRAEARAKSAAPDLQGALSDLNAVRRRANVSVKVLSNKETLLSDIEQERRAEFVLEPHRWFDLVRTGRASTVLGVTDQRKWIFPVPYNDVEVDADLVQNPGYE